MYEGAKVERNDDTNRALITQDLIYRKKGSSLDGTFNNYDAKQTVLGFNNGRPIVGVEKKFPGDITYKPQITRDTRNQGWMYVGGVTLPPGETPINEDYRQIGLIGTGHLTSVEETYADNPNYPPSLGSDDNSEPFIVTGKFGINKTVPTASP